MSVPSWGKHFDWCHIKKKALQFSLDPDIVAAVIMVESAGNTYAARYEPHWKYFYDVPKMARLVGCTRATMFQMQKTSYGLMQVVGGAAYDFGLHQMEDPQHRWPTAMINPEVGMEMGCRILRSKFDKYGPLVSNVYAAYNAGSPRMDKDGKFRNQQAVDRFLRYYRDLK